MAGAVPLQNKDQKDDVKQLFGTVKNSGKLDYVSCWFSKATEFMQKTSIHAAFVSTNSIAQGISVPTLWKLLIEKYGITINFAYRSFVWNNEATNKAHVHVVIIGFSNKNYENVEKIIFNGNKTTKAKNINPYLIDSSNVFIDVRKKALCDAPVMRRGCQPTDNGNLILSPEEKDKLITDYPEAKKFIHRFLMGSDMIKNNYRYCIWLVDVAPNEYRNIKPIVSRIEKVRQFRLKSKKAATRKKAETPMLFDEHNAPIADYIAVPKTSSENRNYIPMDYFDKSVIPGDALRIVPNATLFDFGLLESSVHMAWMRTVAGRMKSDYSYSNTIVYNNFPWPVIDDKTKAKIAKTAQGILDARKLYPNSSLADLYDPLTMPIELRKAHEANDKAVLKAYGLKPSASETEIVQHLFKMYEQLTKK